MLTVDPMKNPNLLRAPEANVTILQPQVYMGWWEKLGKHEITHQMEKGDPWPTRKRVGRLHSIVPVIGNLREGYIQSVVNAAVLDEAVPQLVVLPLTDFHVVSEAEAMRDYEERKAKA